MSEKLTVPSFGESITEVAIETWLVAEGDHVEIDQPVVNIESDKATLELPAPISGVISKILAKAGDYVQVGDVIAEIEAGDSAAEAPAAGTPAAAEREERPKASPAPAGPAARRAMAEKGLSRDQVTGGGPRGRIRKEDVLSTVAPAVAAPQPSVVAPQPSVVARPPKPASPRPISAPVPPQPAPRPDGREEEVVPMSPIRKVIARRLVEATQTTAMLTTFNEIDMSRVITLRTSYKAAFAKRYDIKLGFMSFFVKACVEALKAHPAVNGEVRDQEIVYKNYYDIGVAVGGGKGLTVPVIRSADRLSFAQVEQTIGDFGVRAQANKLKMEELTGGTFTISNGGIYGSLLSTPILNPPQSGILGMHKIEKRAVVVDDQVVVRPMMYVALTYDHRLVDGREAVGFLVRVKDCVENPERILLEV